MIRNFLLCIVILALQCTTASAFTADSLLIKTDVDFNDSISNLTSATHQTSNSYPANSNQGLWIQENLGSDFYDFYASKVVKKTSNQKSLQLAYFLKPGFASAGLSNQSASAKNDINNNVFSANSIQALESSKISFSEDGIEWNPTDLAIVSLGSDYQKFIDDEITAGHTYKEFWDGVETTEFEDFIDEHFGFHDNALLRYLIMLSILLIAILAIAKRAEIADFVMAEENVDRFKKWYSSLHRFG